MMPFGKNLKGYPQSEEGDRKNVIKQTKVRTVIKSDNSWIHKPDDTEGQTIELPPSEEHCSAEPPLETPQKDRPPPPRPSSGYIIRGVFTKPIDSTSVPKTQHQDTLENPKRSVVPEKPVPASVPRVSGSGYKVSSDDYSGRTVKASSKQLQKSAPWEHSYVLSAAKKRSVLGPQVLPSSFPFKSSTQHLKSPFMAKRAEVKEDEVPRERSKTLPSFSRQVFALARDRADGSPRAGNVSRSLFSSPRVQEYSGKREETPTHDPKMESTLLDLSPKTSHKRTFLEYKERNISGARGDIPREEDKDFYPDTDRSSTWSINSTHGSSGSQNDLDEIEITSKKASTFSSVQQYVNRIQGGGYAGPRNQQPVKANEPRFGSEECGVFSPDDQYDRSMKQQYCIPSKNTTKYASASAGTTTEKRYGSSTSSDDTMANEPQSTHSDYQERSVTTIAKETRWDKARLAGAKGGICPDPALQHSDYPVVDPDCAHQQSLKGRSQESSSRRFVSASGERTPVSSKTSSSRDSSVDSEPSPSSSKFNAVICTYCYKEIRSGSKITLESLGICCHESCFKCEICKRKLSDMLAHVYIHKGIIYCDQCYERLF
ncbi:zinc finger protein 185 isoform X2 [Notamacropus eugenii]|uniref:zinc finger protein 185 isoform X2 n=1 Tax=Notamacropus eugenii TaxID=9315 RepID=UPI003B6745C5